VDTKLRYFELTVWPHLKAAYNFARWLVRNNHDAEDIVQESFLKAYNALDTFRGGDARVWILSIVRNTAMNFLRRRKPDLTINWGVQEPEPRDRAPDPEREMWTNRDASRCGRRCRASIPSSQRCLCCAKLRICLIRK
jgi:RNA polymerase sigma factor (sigma-70 family)